jgi:hypothetical protein
MFRFRYKLRTVAIVLLSAGCLCLGVALMSYLHVRHFVARAVRTQGAVIELAEEHDDYGASWHPVFTYSDARGTKHTIQSNTGSSSPDLSPGDRVPVLYDPASPQDGTIDRLFYLWGIPLVTGPLGAFNVLLAVVLFACGRRAASRPHPAESTR